MAYIIADNIMSPLGITTAANLAAVCEGRSALCRHAASELGVGHDFVSSLMQGTGQDEGRRVATHFEQKVLASIKAALLETGDKMRPEHTLLILSTTKGNIEELQADTTSEQMAPGLLAERISLELGLSSSPIVVCNACISGLAALILAARLADQGECDHAIVCGTDDIGRFVVSGFQSLNALSAQECRPFDIERSGLNLGEAVATAIVSRRPTAHCWAIEHGVIRNDAYHISTPSKQAAGLLECLRQLQEYRPSTQDIDFVNLHGTATLFNDQMESIAIERSGLSEVPANAYKGYYGHTLGAAGILETVLSIHTAEMGIILPTRGYEEAGVSGRVSISNQPRVCQGKRFVKTISGFGGCNAAAMLARHDYDTGHIKCPHTRTLKPTHHVTLSPRTLAIDGRQATLGEWNGNDLLTFIYKTQVGNYPKFYKMDPLCRLGFIATELLIKAEGDLHPEDRYRRAVVLFNKYSSLAADRKYLTSIMDSDNYYPSPSAFVYTLPNIVTGEVAIRHGYHGETSFYILPHHDETTMGKVLKATTADQQTTSIIGGWVDYEDKEHFLADITIYNVTT